MKERCDSTRGGLQCRRGPAHVTAKTPHRWWTSHGTAEAQEWPVTADEQGELEEQHWQDESFNRRLAIVRTPRKIADVEVAQCIECPMLCAVTDRCRHPAAGKFGRDVGNPMREPPDWCGLRQTAITIDVKGRAA